MMESLMDSMNPDKIGAVDVVNFNDKRPKEERMSMMIN